jgi:tetratricopeptide (TPR) repeat protein
VELLVLDGMEHLRSGAAVLRDLLRGAPRLRILTTSRTRLGLAEEWTVEVRGLRLPEQPEGLDEAPAGALFLTHARRARGGRPLDPADRPHIYRLCHLLGGLPLALILAAEWLRLLPPAELVADVERGLDLGPAGAGASHPEPWRSLHTVLEDAWRRLTPGEQGVLRRLTVFAGPFSRSAAASVAGATPDALLALADGALLEPDGHGRYALLEPMRRYAEARLREHARDWGAARERHAGYFEAFLARHRPALGREGCALREVGRELPNLRTALTWAAAGEEEGLLNSLAEGLGVYYSLAGHFEAGAGLLEGVAAGRPWLQLEGARLRVRRGQPEAAGRLLQGARGAARRGPDRRLALAVLATTGEVLVESGHASAGRHELEQALVLAGESGLYDEQTAIRLALGQALGAAGEPALARAQGERVRRRARRRGARLTECRAQLLLGEVAAAQGDYDRAEGAHEEALHLAQQVGARPEEAAALLAMGIIQDEGHGQHALGGRLLQEAYTLAGSLDDRFAARLALVPLARNARRRGQSSRARALAGRALDTAREGIGDPLPPLEGAALCELGAQALDAGEEGQALDLARRALETLEGLELPAQQRLAFLVLGAALLALGQAAAAGGAYRRALLLGRATGAWPADGDALAGLARAAMAQGAQEEALGHVAETMERFSLDAARIALRGTQSPAAICLACYEALHAAGDREAAAVAALAAGHRLLLERAAALPPVERQGYLEGVPAQRALLRAWEAALAGAPPVPAGRPTRRSAPPPGPPPAPAALLLAR